MWKEEDFAAADLFVFYYADNCYRHDEAIRLAFMVLGKNIFFKAADHKMEAHPSFDRIHYFLY